MTVKRDLVKTTAIRLVKENGLINLSRSGLCKELNIPDGSFPYLMGCNFSEFVEELRALKITSPLKKVNKTRANPELRREHILNTAIDVAKQTGYKEITRDQIADAAGVSPGLISRYFPAMAQLKKAVMRQAIRCEILEIVAQGLAAKDERACKAPLELKEKAASFLVGL